jgi:hypothetical protein
MTVVWDTVTRTEGVRAIGVRPAGTGGILLQPVSSRDRNLRPESRRTPLSAQRILATPYEFPTVP